MSKKLDMLHKACVFFVLTLMATFCASAQLSNTDSGLQGMTGQVTIFPNANLQQVTVVFLSAVPLTQTSNQIVFVLQGNFDKYPKAWAGTARLLVTHGVFIVAPPEGDSDAPTLAFKFPEVAMPDSVKKWQMETYAIYGVARHGEKTPLTQNQITELETTGSVTPITPTALDAAVANSKHLN
jgi:hypothetical protein